MRLANFAKISISMIAVLMSEFAQADTASEVQAIVKKSECAQYWHNKYRVKIAYVEGVARTYARALCYPERPEVKAASVAADKNAHRGDVLIAYADKFNKIGISNAQSGSEPLRSTYAMLFGLGVHESRGRYCEGRDVSMCFTSADSAEAGLFQTSYGASAKIPELRELYKEYRDDERACLGDQFGVNLTCRVRKSANPNCPDSTSDVAGVGDGADWQRLTKACPAFAVEYGAVVLRKNGGSGKNGTLKGEFGPIRNERVELLPACVTLLQQVEGIVDRNRGDCGS